MDRRRVVDAVSQRLGRRDLVWAGIRGDDAEPLTDLPQLSASFSIIGAYGRRQSVRSMAFEDLTGVRVDLETWDIDEHLDSEEAMAFRHSLLGSLSQPSALLPYRPSRFLSAICFARQDRVLNLGLFGGHQSAFEHKPWVETAVAELGIPHIPWKYIADEEQLQTPSLMRAFPLMLRRSRTSGGEGFVRVDATDLMVRDWPRTAEAFVSVAPYIEGGLPVNVGATVWGDAVTVHHPSVQLVGVANCVSRPFGYCGNDFGLARSLDPPILDQMEHSTKAIGAWLRGQGYKGTFGVDFLVHDGQALFTEVNPRFQGSTQLSCRISIEASEACLMLEHLAAMLGFESRDLDPKERSPLRVRARELPQVSQIVVHWTGRGARRLDAEPLARAMRDGGSASSSDVRVYPAIVTEPEGVVARITVADSVTRTGFDLREPWSKIIWAWRNEVDPPRDGSGPEGVTTDDSSPG